MTNDLTFSEILTMVENASVGAVSSGAIGFLGTPTGPTKNGERPSRKKAKKGIKVQPVFIDR